MLGPMPSTMPLKETPQAIEFSSWGPAPARMNARIVDVLARRFLCADCPDYVLMQELAELLAYANAAVSYQEAVQSTPLPLDYTTTQHVAHDAKDMSDIRYVIAAGIISPPL